MTFMDILRKKGISDSNIRDNKSGNTVFNILTRSFSTSLSNSYKQLKTNIEENLPKDIESVFNKKIVVSDKGVEAQFMSAPDSERKQKAEYKLAYKEMKTFMDKFEKTITNPISLDETATQQLARQNKMRFYYNGQFKEKGEIKTNSNVPSLTKLITLSTNAQVSTSKITTKPVNEKTAVPKILKTIFQKIINDEPYTNNFDLIRRTGFVSTQNLRKLGILIESFKGNKPINAIPIKARLVNFNIIVELLKETFVSNNKRKQGYELLEIMLQEQNLPIKTTKGNVEMKDFIEAYESREDVKQKAKDIQKVLLSESLRDDLLKFKSLKELQNIIYMAERDYANIETNTDAFSEYYGSPQDFISTNVKGKEKEEVLTTVFSDKDKHKIENVFDELEAFKIYYGNLAWLVYKINDTELGTLRIDEDILTKLDLDKEKIYTEYDTKYENIDIKLLTTKLSAEQQEKSNERSLSELPEKMQEYILNEPKRIQERKDEEERREKESL